MMEERLRRLLSCCDALSGLAEFEGQRAVFFHMMPADTDSEAKLYPCCIFDWRPEKAAPRAGSLSVELIADDAGSFIPAKAAAELSAELDGTVLGGAAAFVLDWRRTGAFSAEDDGHIPRITGASMEFDVYKFMRPADGFGIWLERALGEKLGAEFLPVYDMPADGKGTARIPYCASVTELAPRGAGPGYAWLGFEAALRLPAVKPEQAAKAYAALGGLDMLRNSGGAAMLDSVSMALSADGCARGQITLKGRINTLRPPEPSAPLMHTDVNGTVKLKIDHK